MSLEARLKLALADQYSVERELGHGGMAVVYLASDLRHGRRVAIKVLRPEISAILGTERFLREISTVANLTHPHILPLYDSGEADGLLYYVMPYIDGETLRDRLRRERRLPLVDVLRIGSEIADALSGAHDAGIVHRDIKPENILLSRGHALVADFGISRAVDLAAGSRLTETGIVVGTHAYMSPEQALGARDLDARTDIYALGCVLYEMLTGEIPLDAPTLPALVKRRLEERAPSVGVQRSDVAPAVGATIERMLAPDPADRLAAAADIATTLRQQAVVPVLKPRRLLNRRALAIVLAIMSVGAVVRFLSTRGSDFDPSADVANNAIAVLPFSISGAGLDTWREGLMQLFTINLDQLAQWRTISTQTVLARYSESTRSGAQQSLDQQLETARAAGARYALLGTGVALNTDVRLSTTLYDAANGNVVARSQDAAPLDSMLSLVDQLTVELVRDLAGSDATLPVQVKLSAVTTRSLPALLSYLEGMAAYRAAAFDQAIPLFEQAIRDDSTFALAWFYNAQAQNWLRPGPSPEERDAYLRASQHGLRLPFREAALASTNDRLNVFDVARENTRRYPDDPDAAHSLGDLLLHRANEFLLDQAESIRSFDRAIALDPGFAPYYIHRIEIALQTGDLARAKTLLDAYSRLTPPGAPSAAGLMLLLRVLLSPESMQAALLAAADTTPQLVLQWASQRLIGSSLYFSRNLDVTPQALEAAEAIAQAARKSGNHGVWASNRAARASLMRGKVDQAREILAADNRLPRAFRVEFFDRLVRSGYRLSDNERRELGVSASDTASDFAAALLTGAHAARTGDWSAYQLAVSNQRVRQTRRAPASDTVAANVEKAALDALIAYGNAQRGSTRSDVIAAFESARRRTRGVTNHIIQWWLAEQHAAEGNDREALRYFASFSADPLGLLAIARLHEKLGDTVAARAAFARLVEIWKDADADFPPAAEARAGLARLSR